MTFIKLKASGICLLISSIGLCQTTPKAISIKKISSSIVIDGEMKEPDWKTVPAANNFTALRPAPFVPENPANASAVFFLYNNEGIYVGGYFHEKNKDSISAELVGRDGFGNNDYVGIIFDTYNDKINGFEYFVTPLGEQFDAKQAPNPEGDTEDFSWNAVWESAAKIHNDGWSFEMFIPYSAIRFGKANVQDWGLNIVRRRQKSGQQLFWQSIDPNVNGFLTQEGMLTGLENIKPPLRLQFSPYFSVYQNQDDLAAAGTNKNTTTFNGGMDIKYGLSPAFTLDMTLIPDFGQVQTDNLVLNLTPFEQRFNDNRPFFTEGAELFNKGNLFYSRRIPTKLYNATKISGRTQNGLGIGLLNAVAKPEFSFVKDPLTGKDIKVEMVPLTNYNVAVLNQSLKNNSSISLVNTSVWRSGTARDANVTAALFDLFNKRNMWNFGGNVSISAIYGSQPATGYAHSIYLAKVSGKFTFNVWQDLIDAKYDKTDLGYFTNNNSVDQGAWFGYNWTKPTRWYNQLNVNTNFWYSRLVSPIDVLKRKEMMFQNGGINFNANAQLRNLWWARLNVNAGPNNNDFYEARQEGRVFKNKARYNVNVSWESNSAKKISWGGNLSAGMSNLLNRKRIDGGLFGKIRFSSKFSVDHSISLENSFNQVGWAWTDTNVQAGQMDTIYFSRRKLNTVENVTNMKYNFTNRMGITLRMRHYWSKVAPEQFYVLDLNGNLQTPAVINYRNVNQNFNFVSVDMVYTWQFAQGSFINIVWKNIERNAGNVFERNYLANLGKTINGNGYNNITQFSSLSFKVIYFLDYLTERIRIRQRNGKAA